MSRLQILVIFKILSHNYDHFGIVEFLSLFTIQIYQKYNAVTPPIPMMIIGEGMNGTREIMGEITNNIQKIGQYIIKHRGLCYLQSLIGGYNPQPIMDNKESTTYV